MEENTSSESDDSSARQEVLSVLWILIVHFRVHNDLLPVPILRRINQVHTLPLWIFKIRFNIVEETETGGNEPRGLRAPLILSKHAEPHFLKGTGRNCVTWPARATLRPGLLEKPIG